MSDCSPLRLADDVESSPDQSMGSKNSQSAGNTQPETDGWRNHQDRTAGDNLTRIRSQSESSTKSGQLRYGARNVIELFIPVSLCMIIVVGTMKATNSYRYSSQTVIWYAQMMFTDQSVDTGTRVWQSFANALIMLVLIVIMTTVLILLYKFRCYATIHGWLILSSLILLFMFAIMYIAEILKVYNIPMDVFTLLVFIWNFGVVGMICIHWKGPLLLQQGYLIVISALLALVFIRSLPDWTTWTVLAIVSVWDLVAVLCPRGPLRILVETAQERNEAIFPALIYSSTMIWEVCTMTAIPMISMADTKDNERNSEKSRKPKSSSSHRSEHNNQAGGGASNSRRPKRVMTENPATPSKRNQHPVEIHYEDGVQPPEIAFVQPNISASSEANWVRPSRHAPNRDSGTRIAQARISQGTTEATINFQPNETRAEYQVEEERGVKLGLGDFIFFSLLVGKASSYGDWTITISCYVAILVGLCLTLSLLAVFRKALPALPISIAFGLSAFFLSYVFVAPFYDLFAAEQVFV